MVRRNVLGGVVLLANLVSPFVAREEESHGASERACPPTFRRVGLHLFRNFVGQNQIIAARIALFGRANAVTRFPRCPAVLSYLHDRVPIQRCII